MRGTPRLPIIVHCPAAVLPVQNGSTTQLDTGDAELSRLVRDLVVEVNHPQTSRDPRTKPDAVDTSARLGRTCEATRAIRTLPVATGVHRTARSGSSPVGLEPGVGFGQGPRFVVLRVQGDRRPACPVVVKNAGAPVDVDPMTATVPRP